MSRNHRNMRAALEWKLELASRLLREKQDRTPFPATYALKFGQIELISARGFPEEDLYRPWRHQFGAGSRATDAGELSYSAPMNYANDLARDAHRTIAGFVFQVNSTILHWLNLEPETFLDLESGEDIDVVRAEVHESEENFERLLTQLKQLSDGALTLRNREALKSVANFCGHRKANPAWKLRFRFVTTLPIGEEREGWQYSSSAIQTWERVRRSEGSEQERAAGTNALRDFLNDCRKPSGFSKLTWTSLEEALAGQAPYTFADIVAKFEWAAGVGDYLQVKKQVYARLEMLLPEATQEMVARKFDQLFAFVFERLCQPGTKRLDAGTLRERLIASDVSHEYLAATRRLVDRLEALEERVARLEVKVDWHDEQLQSHEASIEKLEEAEEGSLKTFYPAAEFFSSTNPGVALYDLDQRLRGRQSTRDQLDRFLNDDAARIAVVEGSGGIGKTKVLRDWSSDRTDWETRWTGPNSGVWHPGTANEIPGSTALIIADDAHRYDDLERLTTLVATWAGSTSLKLVVAVRKSDNNKLRQALSMIDESAITRLPALGPLDHDDVVGLAEEILGPDPVVDPERLARVSADSPFITVVGGRLVAQGRITPELLNNDKEFQRRVFDTLASQYDGLLPSGNYSKSQFMQFISALQPVKESDNSFIEKAGAFLGLKNSEVRRGFTSLDVNGVLKRASKGSSVIPDLLADYLLGLASVEEDGQPTEFADEVFESFEDSHFSNLLKNLAVLDWRIAQRDDGSRLLDKIWARLTERFRAQDARERLHMLRAIEGTVGYLPERVHALITVAMDEPAATANLYNLHRVTQRSVLEALPAFLGGTILHESTGQDAFNRLWELAQHETEAVRGRAQRAMEQAIGYAVNKDLLFNAHVLSIVEDSLNEAAVWDGRFTPLDLLDELMVREIDHTERVGMAFQNSVHTINHKAVVSLRQRVFGIIAQCLASENPRIAYRAAKSLGSIASVFIPMRRDHESAEERVWHDAERNQALDIIERRLEIGTPAVSTVWKIRRVLQTTAEDSRQSADIRQRATAMLGSLSLPDLFCTFHVLCTDEWGYNTEADGFVVTSDRRRAEETKAIAELTNRYPDPADQLRALASVVRLARAAGVNPVSVDSFLSRLCRGREFLSAFSEHLASDEESVLRQVAGIAIRAWRATDKTEYLRYGIAFINVTNDFMVHSVAAEISSGPALQNVTAEDVEILSILASRTEPWILRTIFQALGTLSKPGPFSDRARQLVRQVDIGSDSDVADGYCHIVGPGPFRVSASSLDLETIRAMAAKLVPVYELDKHHFGEFVVYVCGMIPLEIVDLIERRLELARTVMPDDQRPLYKPLPSPQHWSTLFAVRQSPDYEEALRRLFDLGLRFPEQTPYLDDFFWCFGTLDQTTLGVLDDGIHSDDFDRFRRTLSLLCDGPKRIAFTHPGFALHVLTECEMRSAEWGNTAMDILANNCIVTGGVRAIGPNATPIGAGVADQARPPMEQCEPGSPLHRLYSRLTQIQPMPIPDFRAELELEEDDY